MHKTIGLLGGLSPESTATYYQYITRTYVERYGDHSYPQIVIYSVSFQEFMDWQARGQWDQIARKMIEAMESMHRAGADFGLIATNTMHYVFDEVQEASPMPLISIVDSTVEAVRKEGSSKVGLLGTMFTMSHSFYSDKLRKEGIEVSVPGPSQRKEINRIIYEELAQGQFREDSRRKMMSIVQWLGGQGCDGVILGCTEIPLLVRQEDCEVHLFDTCIIHAEKALNRAVQR